MTTQVTIVNRALQVLGTRTTVTSTELSNNSTNEAIQANLIYDSTRRRLLRMAPWNCALKTANLVYITSVTGTPENTSPATTLWTPGQPSPPWAYEYQYPVDCLRACWIIPATQTGYSGGVPITTAVTGGAPSFWAGPPVKFKIQTDTFRPVTAVTIAAAGLNHAVGDVITLPYGPTTSPPIGAPVQILVTTVNGTGGITGASVVAQVPNSSPALGGSYFAPQTNPVAQSVTTGVGINATFNLTFGAAAPQRVILCNQEFATLVYSQDVADPNIFDDDFIEAYVRVLGAQLANALTSDKTLANSVLQEANMIIEQARTTDGNEGLTINDTTPDWIRVRGIHFPQQYSGPAIGYDWGSLWPYFG